MNELKIWCEGGALLYWETKMETCYEAFNEFDSVCNRIGLNIDNLRVIELELQDSDFNIFDTEVIK